MKDRIDDIKEKISTIRATLDKLDSRLKDAKESSDSLWVKAYATNSLILTVSLRREVNDLEEILSEIRDGFGVA